MATNGNVKELPVVKTAGEIVGRIADQLDSINNRLEFIEGTTADTSELLRRREHGDPHTVTLLYVKFNQKEMVFQKILLAPHYYDRAWLTLQYDLPSDFVILTDATITITDDVFSTLFYNGISLSVEK